ncbi:hypothetical protein [Clostridium uliginosum]|uniref:Putative cell wall binding repeat-containing protein n=1 Tax=Clostridium uliginosum TaxID=119641 RepID=A0A1I1NKD9_9CLOT|nr:Putative cell wall binding repeat-containing protein [Clostridium uliginosum]
MKRLRLTKVIASALVIASVMALNPIGASASWKQNNTGWWYTEGSSWFTGWRLINSNWYYFKSNGYLVQNAWMCDGYYLNLNGVWTETAKYARKDIIKNGIACCESGKVCYEAGDQSNLKVINSEPCIYTWDKNEVSRYIGMNTLNVYDCNGNKVDKVTLNSSGAESQTSSKNMTSEKALTILKKAYPDYTYIDGGELDTYYATGESAYRFTFRKGNDKYIGWVLMNGQYVFRFVG